MADDIILVMGVGVDLPSFYNSFFSFDLFV